MTTATFTSKPTNAEGMAQWVQPCHDALVTIGMIQAADTGQIDIATAPVPTTDPTPAGYEIWRFDDALQATHPIFFKVEYGTSFITSGCGMWLTVGKGSDGAGDIVEILVPRTYVGGSSFIMTDALTGYASSGDGSMCALFPFSAGGSQDRAAPSWLIDRSRAADGTATSDGVVVAVRTEHDANSPGSSTSTNAGAPALWCAAYDTAARTYGAIPVALPHQINGTNLAPGVGVGGAVLAPVFPWTAFPPGVAPWQPLAAVSYAGGDVSSGAMTVRMAGSDRTYLFIGLTNSAGWGMSLNPGASQRQPLHAIGIGILWE